LIPYKNIKWLAGSRPFSGYSIGGHIHFSNIELNNHLLRALDSYLGFPLFLIENQTTAVKRRSRYGFLADIRTKDHGGFEYRTPASWLISPDITGAVLCLAKIVASNYLQLTKNCFITVDAQKAFYEGNQEYLRSQFDDIWSDIIKLDMYEAYKDELQIILEMIDDGNIWDEKEDIRKAWGLNIKSKSAASNTTSYENSADDNSALVLNANSSRRRNPTRRSTINSNNSRIITNTTTNNSRGRRNSRSSRLLGSGPAVINNRRY
jgi:hypothetical protein